MILWSGSSEGGARCAAAALALGRRWGRGIAAAPDPFVTRRSSGEGVVVDWCVPPSRLTLDSRRGVRL